MTPGFHNSMGLLTRSFDGRHFIVEDHLHFVDKCGNEYRTKFALTTDGGSIPNLGIIGGAICSAGYLLSHVSEWFGLLVLAGLLVCFAGVYLMPYGRWWRSYVFHDALFKRMVERWSSTTQRWEHYRADESRSNALLFEAMEIQEDSPILISAVWLAVHWFGWRAWNDDRKASHQRRKTIYAARNTGRRV